jgi:hypothetical protein
MLRPLMGGDEGNVHLDLVTVPIKNWEGEFWISEVVNDGDNLWSFTLHGPEKVFIARFKYHDEVAAKRASVALGAGLQGALCVELKE